MITIIITTLFVLLYYGTTIRLLKGIRFGSKELALCGIIAGLSSVLEMIRIPLPTGSSIPMLTPLPLILLALTTDKRLAMISGFVVGLLVILLVPGWAPVHWAQLIVEHLVCFSCFGYAAVWGTDKRWKILCGLLTAFALSLFGHTMSGVIFFSQNAWAGWSAWGYSIAYNFSENLPLFAACTAAVLLIPLDRIRQAVKY